MAGNRKNQSAAVHFGPALKVVLLCSLVCSVSVGYVWQKSRNIQLGQKIGQRESRLKQLREDNQKLADQLARLHLPPFLDQRVKELNLGLVPASAVAGGAVAGAFGSAGNRQFKAPVCREAGGRNDAMK